MLSLLDLKNNDNSTEFETHSGSSVADCDNSKNTSEENEEMVNIDVSPVKAGFQIKYKIADSGIHGLGIITEEDIPEGTLIWKYMQGVNIRTYDGEEAVRKHLESLPSDKARQDWLTVVYLDFGVINEHLDEGDYWNHSNNPNTASYSSILGSESDIRSSYAIRDIKKGEELLEDYGINEWPQWLTNLYDEYNVDYSFFDSDPSKR